MEEFLSAGSLIDPLADAALITPTALPTPCIVAAGPYFLSRLVPTALRSLCACGLVRHSRLSLNGGTA